MIKHDIATITQIYHIETSSCITGGKTRKLTQGQRELTGLLSARAADTAEDTEVMSLVIHFWEFRGSLSNLMQFTLYNGESDMV